MAKPISFGEMDVNLTASMEGLNQARSSDDIPFRIALLGDFSGRASRGVFAPEILKPIRVDRDNLEELPGKLATEIHLSLAGDGEALVIRIEELDDFHPDQLYQSIDVFQSLKKLRRALNDSKAYEAAAAEVRQWLNITPSHQQKDTNQSPADEATPESLSGTNLLDAILDESAGGAPLPPPTRTQRGSTEPLSEMDGFLKEIVGPHLVPQEDPQKEELIAAVDIAISELMKAILHHPEFQAVESAWQSLSFLIRRLNMDEKLQIFLCDFSKEEFAGALYASDDLSRTIVYRQFVEKAVETMGGTPWSLLSGLYTFEQTLEDIETIGRMAKIASLAGAPFVAEATSHFLGCPSLEDITDPSKWRAKRTDEEIEAWNMLRRLPESKYLGMTMFRLLQRLPFGYETDPIDMFDLEEFTSTEGHDDYLWGNPAAGIAYLLGASFLQYEWQMRGRLEQDIQNLPLHVHKEDGETEIKPCAEVVLTDKAVSEIIDAGFMPMLSFHNQDRVRLGRFQSVNLQSVALAGRWKM